MFNFTNEDAKCKLKLYIGTKLAKIKTTENAKCCQNKVNIGTLLYGWRE